MWRFAFDFDTRLSQRLNLPPSEGASSADFHEEAKRFAAEVRSLGKKGQDPNAFYLRPSSAQARTALSTTQLVQMFPGDAGEENKIPIAQEDIDAALLVADKLGIHENTAAGLVLSVKDTHAIPLSFPDTPLYLKAIFLYNQACAKLSTSLAVMVDEAAVPEDDPSFSDLADKAKRILPSLLPDVVVCALDCVKTSNAQEEITKLTTTLGSELPEQLKTCIVSREEEYIDSLLTIVARAIVVETRSDDPLASFSELPASEVLEMLQVLEAVSQDAPVDAPPRPVVAGLFTVVLCILEKHRRQELLMNETSPMYTADAVVPNPLCVQQPGQAGDGTIHSGVTMPWAHTVLNRLLKFVYGLVINDEVEREQARQTDALNKTGIFDYLRLILESSFFTRSSATSAFIADTYRFLLEWILEDSVSTSRWRAAADDYWSEKESQQLQYAFDNGYDRHHDTYFNDDFQQLLLAAAALCKLPALDEAELMADVWKYFFESAVSVHPNNQQALLDLMESFIIGPTTASVISVIFENASSSGMFTWANLQQALAEYIATYKNSTEQAFHQDLPAQKMLRSFLLILANTSRHRHDMTGGMVYMFADGELLQLLLEFLRQPTFNELKGAALCALEGLAHNHEAAWFLLRQILDPSDAFLSFRFDADESHAIIDMRYGLANDYQSEQKWHTFDETIAIVNLLRTLLPKLDGLGHSGSASDAEGVRTTLMAYVSFAERILGDALTASYRRPAEKWELVHALLSLIQALITTYTPNPADTAADTDEVVDRTARRLRLRMSTLRFAGYLAYRAVTESDTMYRTIAQVVEMAAGNHALALSGKSRQHFVACIEPCMDILNMAFTQQSLLEKSEGVSRSLSSLLLDYMQSFAFFLTRDFEDKYTLKALMLLWHMLRTSHRMRDYEGIFRAMGEDKMKIITDSLRLRLHDIRPSSPQPAHGDVDPGVPVAVDVHGKKHASTANAVAFSILHLFLHLLYSSTKNFGFLLLGLYDVVYNDQPIQTALVGSKTCIHSFVEMMSPKNPTPLVNTNPEFAELVSMVLFTLTYLPDTSKPVRQYLQGVDFYGEQLDALGTYVSTGLSSSQAAAQQHFTAWLLKIIALELNAPDTDGQTQLVHQMLNLRDADIGRQVGRRRVMLRVLEPVSFEAATTDPPHFMQLDPAIVNSSFKRITKVQPCREGTYFCDLDDLVNDICRQVQEVTDAVYNDLDVVRDIASQTNAINERRAAGIHLLNAWQRAASVALIQYAEHTPAPARTRIASHFLRYILGRFPENPSHSSAIDPEIFQGLSDILVMLMSVLMQAALVQDVRDTRENLTDGVMRRIFDGIVFGILFRECTPRITLNHYGALLFYLRIARETREQAYHERLQTPNRRFLETIVRDASESSSFSAILATTALKEILHVTGARGTVWLNYFGRLGHINAFVVQLRDSDEDLIASITSNDERIALYVQAHLARTALLLEIASQSGGAPLLFMSDLLRTLVAAKFVDARPIAEEVSAGPLSASSSVIGGRRFVNDAISAANEHATRLERHRQIMIPVLHLLITLLRQCRREETKYVGWLLTFVQKHLSSYFRPVLKDRTPTTVDGLEELSAVTSIFRLLAKFGPLMEEKLGYNDLRFQQQLLALAHKYSSAAAPTAPRTSSSLSSSSSRRGYSHGSGDDEEASSSSPSVSSRIAFLKNQIVFDTLSYIRSRMDEKSVSTHQRKDIRLMLHPSISKTTEERPSLLIVFQNLSRALSSSRDASKVALGFVDDFAQVGEMSSDRLEALGVGPAATLEERRHLAKTVLKALIGNWKRAESLAFMHMELAVYILWRHVEVYLNYASLIKSAGRPAAPGSAVRQLRVGTSDNPLHAPSALDNGERRSNDLDAAGPQVAIMLQNIASAEIHALRKELSARSFSCDKGTILDSIREEEKSLRKKEGGKARRPMIETIVNRFSKLQGMLKKHTLSSTS